MVGAERAGRWAEPVVTGQRVLWPGYLQLDTDASWSPSETQSPGWEVTQAGNYAKERCLDLMTPHGLSRAPLC